MKSGDKVGVVGLGGLGHMAAKLAVSKGADVTLFSRTTDKQRAATDIGAKLVAENDTAALEAGARSSSTRIPKAMIPIRS